MALVWLLRYLPLRGGIRGTHRRRYSSDLSGALGCVLQGTFREIQVFIAHGLRAVNKELWLGTTTTSYRTGGKASQSWISWTREVTTHIPPEVKPQGQTSTIETAPEAPVKSVSKYVLDSS